MIKVSPLYDHCSLSVKLLSKACNSINIRKSDTRDSVSRVFQVIFALKSLESLSFCVCVKFKNFEHFICSRIFYL